MTETSPARFWALSGTDADGHSSARLVTLDDDRAISAAPVAIPARARFAARRGDLLYVVGDDGLTIVSPDGVQVDSTALPPGPWCHVALAEDRLVAVEYTAALVRVLQLAADGTVAAVTDELTMAGSGPHERRQTSAHPHHVLALPDHRAVAIADLGSDRLWLRRFDGARERLEDAGSIPAPAGSGPRHTRSTGPRSLAVACELANSVVLFEQDPAATCLADGWSVRAEVPISGTGTGSMASEIVLSPDARFAYVATRGDDAIAVVDLERGSRIALVESGGAFPQHIALVGDALVVANQRSDSLAIFARDPERGTLRLLSSSTALPQPVCLF